MIERNDLPQIESDTTERIVEPGFSAEDTDVEFSLRPKRLNEYIGQEKVKEEIMVCLFAPDLENFRGTAWGAVNAISDFATHNQPRRNTENYRENNWGRVIDGHPVIDAFCDILYDRVGIKA